MHYLVVLLLLRETPPSLSSNDMATRSEFLTFFRDTVLNKVYNPHNALIDGSLWPPGANAISMAGQRRLDSFSALVATAVEDEVPGHVIETGVWRGGASFVAAKTIELLGECASGRKTFLADSFSGIPKQKGGQQDATAYKLDILNNNNVDWVRRDAQSLGLDLSRLQFIVGYFNESLPRMITANPSIRFAVVRLDGDTYQSTHQAIRLLYPRLSPGGFLIVDDYVDWVGCRQAVDRYRRAHNIGDPLIVVPHDESAGEIPRGVYWRKQPAPNQRVCATGTAADSMKALLRPVGWIEHHTSKGGSGPHVPGAVWRTTNPSIQALVC